MSDAQFYHISKTGKLTHTANPAKALALSAQGGFIWLDYYQPTKETLLELVVPLGLHPLSIEDCVDENQVPKVENYPGNTYVLFNDFTYRDGKLSIHEVDFIIGENFLVTVSGHDSNDGSVLSGMEHLVEGDMESARQGPAFLMHTLLDDIVDRKFLAVEALENELDSAEESLLADASHFNPSQLLHLRRELLVVRKSLFHEREILVKICRKDCPFITESSIFHYRDIYDHLAKFFELTETYRDIVTSLMEMHLSMLNNQMTKAANDTNMAVRRLTLITTIFMPLTLLAGIGGMSEWSMMTGPSNWKIAYPAFLLAMVVLGIANFFFLKWLDRRDKHHT